MKKNKLWAAVGAFVGILILAFITRDKSKPITSRGRFIKERKKL